MLHNDASPNSVSQFDDRPSIARKQYHYFTGDENVDYSNHLDKINDSGEILVENDGNFDSLSTSRAPGASSSSRSSYGMDIYLSPHSTKDYYGPNVAKYYTTSTDTGQGGVNFTSSTYDSMSNVALSDLYSFRDEFSILHSDMRPSEAPWLYAVNKQKARELLAGEKNRKGISSLSTESTSSSSTSSKKQRSPRFDIISKRNVPCFSSKKDLLPAGESNERSDTNIGIQQQHNVDEPNLKTEFSYVSRGSVNNSYYILFKNSIHSNKMGIFRLVILLIIVAIIHFGKECQVHPYDVFSKSKRWQETPPNSTAYDPMSVRTNILTSIFWKSLSSTVNTPPSVSMKTQCKSGDIKSAPPSRRNMKVPLKKRVKKIIEKG